MAQGCSEAQERGWREGILIIDGLESQKMMKKYQNEILKENRYLLV